MQSLPFFHSYDPVQKWLRLRGASYLPEELLACRDEIEVLDVNDGTLTELPDWLPELSRLRIVFGSNNLFEEVPPVLAECSNLYMAGFKSCRISTFAEDSLPKSLVWLVLTDNTLKELPHSIGELSHLKKVSLAGNQLFYLPEEMQLCTEIEFLRLSANAFTQEPAEWVFSLPKLAWYGDAGNPFSDVRDAGSVQEYSWDAFRVGELLGESPSSEVFAAVSPSGEQVALKLYRGELTSDGFPRDDMRAALVAGRHAQLIQLLGRVTDGPDGRQGLVLERVPDSFTALGLPPSLSTNSRDVYPDSATFSSSVVTRVLQSVAEAAVHLHSRGVSHGDLYAHNILVDPQGTARLGDFGAASLYDGSSGSFREALDVRAFGYLMEELLQRSSSMAKLSELKDACLVEDGSARPSFYEILGALEEFTG
ncbi:MAG: protein kinase [Candidatus Doudnabacteria bacterium]|nr:protein kinase [Candidatus Doudnabacteria bacterium]